MVDILKNERYNGWYCTKTIQLQWLMLSENETMVDIVRTNDTMVDIRVFRDFYQNSLGLENTYRLVQIERPKLCPREFLTPFFRVRPRNFAHIFWKAVSKTRRVFFLLFGVSLSRYPGFDPPPGQVLQPGPRITGHRDMKKKKKTLFEF